MGTAGGIAVLWRSAGKTPEFPAAQQKYIHSAGKMPEFPAAQQKFVHSAG